MQIIRKDCRFVCDYQFVLKGNNPNEYDGLFEFGNQINWKLEEHEIWWLIDEIVETFEIFRKNWISYPEFN